MSEHSDYDPRAGEGASSAPEAARAVERPSGHPVGTEAEKRTEEGPAGDPEGASGAGGADGSRADASPEDIEADPAYNPPEPLRDYKGA
jgi:hypothetical protein